MNLIRIYISIILVIASTSCSTIKVNYSGKKVDKVQSIALFSTMIGKIQQPIFPLIDAGIFNEKTNSIADQIMDIQKKNIDKCQQLVASSLEKSFNCQVLYSDSLHNQVGFNELKQNFDFKNALRIKNDHYPIIITAKDDINPFKYENGNVTNYFSDPLNYKTVVSNIGKNINSDLIAISYSTLSVGSVGYFGIYGYLRLDTYLYIFDKDGDLLTKASNCSAMTSVSGKKIDEYQSQLDNLSLILEPLMNKVALNYKSL